MEAAYNFLSGNDLNFNWYSYNHSTNTLLQRDSMIYSFIQDELTSATFFSNVAFSLKTTWNAVNFELGQLVNFTNSTTIRFHGGFQYANIQTTVANTIASYNTANEANEYLNITNSNTSMKYSGFGPRLGIDLFYNLKQNFTIYGKTASALLVGGSKFNQFVLGEYTAVNVYSLSGPLNVAGSGSTTAVVPEIEAKTGARYTHTIGNSDITLDAGWMWANYFSAQNTSASAHGLAASGRPIQTQLNFQIQGGYVGLKWLGNIA